MELTPLRYLVAIGQTGHMTRAAEVLGVSQPALSAAVRKLEDELGVPLFDRTGRGVALTQAGRVFLEHASSALRDVEAGKRAVRALAGLETGTIRVGGGATAMAYLLPTAVRAVRDAHPGLRFYVREAGSDAIAGAILTGELDLGIVTLPITHPGSGDLMNVHRVRDELRLIVPPGHALDGQRGFRWKDLAEQPVVGFEAGTAVRAVIDAAAFAHGVALDVVMEVRSIQSIEQMVRAGIGVGFVSRFALDASPEAPQGLSCRDGRISRELAVVRRRDRTPSPAAAAFERALLARRRNS
ncbi:MAG: LysR family transcriptional regulator [Phycisphaeraceae bacterium]|nr:LysR family transcriptional regulator [Phycisphaeraceae bacterium]